MGKKILLIDADSIIPNIALGKLSTFYKEKGYEVDFKRLHIPYQPSRRKQEHTIDGEGYEKVYCSVVFSESKAFIKGENICFGGTGHDLKTVLPDGVEECEVDYSLWPDNDISYGFITRGCIRNCSFCVVQQKEGYIRQVNTIAGIVRHKKAKFLDNNIFALPNHYDILQELGERKLVHEFNQGLDIRLLNSRNAKLLSHLKYINEFVFALDNINLMPFVKKQVHRHLSWCRPWKLKFYVYVNPNMPLSDTIRRVEFLKSQKILPFIMRDITCWQSKYNRFYIDLAAYVNSVIMFKQFPFSFFLEKLNLNKERIAAHSKLYEDNL